MTKKVWKILLRKFHGFFPFFKKKKSQRTMILRGKEVLFERIFMEKLVLNKKRILRKNSWVLFFKESLGSKNPMIFL